MEDGTSVNDPFLKHMHNVFTTGKYSDLTISCQNHYWAVHKLVVCGHSEFFSKACEPGFAEAEEGNINLPEDDPELIELLLYCCYHFDYSDETESESPPHVINAQVFQLADKYLIQPLQELAERKFLERVKAGLNATEFAEAVQQVYDVNIPKAIALKNILLEIMEENAATLFNTQDNNEFRKMVCEVPEFLFDHSKRLAAKPTTGPRLPSTQTVNWFKCPGRNSQTYGSVFSVSKSAPDRWHFSCPNSCNVKMRQDFWAQYMVQ